MKLFSRKKGKELSEEEKEELLNRVLQQIEEELKDAGKSFENDERENLKTVLRKIEDVWNKKKAEKILFECVSILARNRVDPAAGMTLALFDSMSRAPLAGKAVKKYHPKESVELAQELSMSFAVKWSTTKAYEKFWKRLEIMVRRRK